MRMVSLTGGNYSHFENIISSFSAVAAGTIGIHSLTEASSLTSTLLQMSLILSIPWPNRRVQDTNADQTT